MTQKQGMKGILAVMMLFVVGGCALELDGTEIQEAIEACDGMTLDELKTVDSLSTDCRAAIHDLLPTSEDDLRERLVAAGRGEVDGSMTLFVVGTDDTGQGRDLAGIAEITVMADGEVVPESAYSMVAAADLSGTVAAISGVLDYSGSMLDEDIDDAADVFDAIYSIPVGFEAEYSIFSDAALRKTPFTSDSETLASAVARDDTFVRSSTALFDAMGAGIQSLADHGAPVKLLVVATDGYENASSTYEFETELYEMAIESGVHIVVLGSLLADLAFMRRAADETDGYFLYARDFLSLQSTGEQLAEAFGRMGGIVMTDPAYGSAERYDVVLGGVELNF